jgi:hypothetical protein
LTSAKNCFLAAKSDSAKVEVAVVGARAGVVGTTCVCEDIGDAPGTEVPGALATGVGWFNVVIFL